MEKYSSGTRQGHLFYKLYKRLIVHELNQLDNYRIYMKNNKLKL